MKVVKQTDRQGLMLRPDGPLASKQLAPDSWFTAANTAQPLSAQDSTVIYSLVLVWELHGMVWMYPGGLLPKWVGIVWWCWLHPGGLLLKWFPRP